MAGGENPNDKPCADPILRVYEARKKCTLGIHSYVRLLYVPYTCAAATLVTMVWEQNIA